jgi:hypothetical protein
MRSMFNADLVNDYEIYHLMKENGENEENEFQYYIEEKDYLVRP